MLELSPALAQELEDGRAIVVPSAQRAAALHLAFAARQLSRGRRAFRTPQVHSLGGWLARQNLRDPGGAPLRRLGALDEWLLWRSALHEAVADAPPPLAGLQPDERLIEPLRRAARLLGDWCIPENALQATGVAEHLLLARTLARVDGLAAARGALPAHRVLAGLVSQLPRSAPRFAGFGALTAAHQALLAAWSARGAPVHSHEPGGAPGGVAILAAPDPLTELQLAAQWCREQLQADPRRRLLLLIPDLHLRQPQVQRILDEYLQPQSLLEAGEAAARAWAIEGGEPLSDYPAVRHALLSLRLLCGELELAEISAWLRGAFWSAPAPAARAGLDVWLRRVLRPRCALPHLLQALGSAPGPLAATASGIAVLLRAASGLLEPQSRTTLAAWATRFQSVLSRLALLPGAPDIAQPPRSSAEQQVQQRLSELLRECARAGAGLSQLAAGEALSLLARLAGQTRFEPATGDPPVTVSAALVDPVVRYDGIRVIGLTSDALPVALRLNPFIPAEAQRRAGLPQASAAGVLAQARALLHAWRQSAGELVVSWPERGEDREWLPSPLLPDLAAGPPRPAPQAGPGLAQALRTGGRIEEFTDDTGLDWDAAVPLPMGTRAIELQSRCPFRAYAELRLSATPLEEPGPGITPAERGRMLHRALELLWLELKDSTGLQNAQGTGTLDPLAERCARRAALETLGLPDAGDDPQGQGGFRRAAVAREQARAERLLRAHVRVELARPAFAVQALETARRVELGAALLDVRIDRIDRLADGTQLIIDYKTGQPVTPDWLAERTTHPQLLVYLQAADGPVSAMAVEHLTPRQVVYKGIGDEAARLPGIAPLTRDPAMAATAWREQQAAWRASVTRLGQDFIEGRAGVDPADGVCRTCHLHAFCRIADAPAGAAAEAPETGA